jgi:hypothetical protein
MREEQRMGKKDARIDQYIAKSQDFAKPILTHLRSVVHATVPEVEETLKWSSPTFMYKGMLCLNDQGVKVARKPSGPARPLRVPPVFRTALNKSPRAAKTFDGFSTSKRNEYVEWIAEAKTDATRDKRVKTSIEWLAEGKSRNWKYENC